MRIPTISYEHLVNLSDEVGIFQHADHDQPRRTHGYCTVDMARALVVLSRQTRPEQAVQDLRRMAVRFLTDAQDDEGRVCARRAVTGGWEDEPGTEDCWGLAMWAWGTVLRLGEDAAIRRWATSCFTRSARQRASRTRAMCFAALGAAEVLAARPHNVPARELLVDAVTMIGPLRDDPDWPWPEDRLTYANAAVCEVLIAAGDLLDQPEVLADGLQLLDWLLRREMVDGHLSPTPSGGSGPTDAVPGFDQQPVEVAAMADACARALAVTGEERWREGVMAAAGWVTGDNDGRSVMWDSGTGGSYDGLQRTGPSVNQGAESTVALIGVLQRAGSAVIGRTPAPSRS